MQPHRPAPAPLLPRSAPARRGPIAHILRKIRSAWRQARPLAAAGLVAAIVPVAGAGAEPGPARRAPLATSAAELPALHAMLARAGWTATPELSGAFQPGRIFSAETHRLQIDDCFDTPVQRSTYTSAEVVTRLQAGVSVGLGLVAGQGELVKRLRFGAPEHLAMPALQMQPSEACRRTLREASAAGLDLRSLYVVQEALLAEIAEQTCGRMDARGRIVGLGAGELSLSVACAQESLEPVAVAYRVQPLSALIGVEAAPAEPWAPILSPAMPQGWSPIEPSPPPEIADGPLLSLQFAPGSAQLDPAALAALQALAPALLAEGAPPLRVEAHTDDGGEAIANLSVSQARAEAVKAALVALGIPPSTLIARGYGSSAPIASNQTEAGRAANRRTELWRVR